MKNEENKAKRGWQEISQLFFLQKTITELKKSH
jgi:hypothetical protein